MNDYVYRPFNSIVPNCPVTILQGKLHYEGEPGKEDPDDEGLTFIATSNNDGWGSVKNLDIMTEEAFPMPYFLSLRYLTMTDGHCYAIEEPLDAERADELWQKQQEEHPKDPFTSYVVGTAPFGGVAVWLRGRTRSVLLHWLKAQEAEFNETEKARFGWAKEMSEYEVISLKELENDMRQFTYRYVACEEHWDWETLKWIEYDDKDPYYDDLDVDSIEDHRTDGTFNYLKGDDDQQHFHTAGKPQRITVKWHAGDTEYMAHFWLSKLMITAFFNYFFQKSPDSQADLLLRLDPEQQAYQLALRSENHPKAYIIPWNAYQLIVFKDGTEHFMSQNYQLEDGQWSWMWHK